MRKQRKRNGCMSCMMSLYHSDTTNQHEDQHNVCSQENDLRRRSYHNSRQQTISARDWKGLFKKHGLRMNQERQLCGLDSIARN